MMRSLPANLAAASSFAIAVLHVGITMAGPRAYAYFGAADLGRLEGGGSLLPDAVTAVLAAVFGAGGYYALAGANRTLWRPPLLKTGLVVASAVFTIRGAALVPELFGLASGSSTVPARYAVFSLVSLITGIAFCLGTWHAIKGEREIRTR